MRLLQITECSKFVGNCTLNYTINIYHCIAFADNTVQWCCIYFCCTFFITVGFKTILQSLPKFRFHTNQQFSIVGKSVSICLKGFFFFIHFTSGKFSTSWKAIQWLSSICGYLFQFLTNRKCSRNSAWPQNGAYHTLKNTKSTCFWQI